MAFGFNDGGSDFISDRGLSNIVIPNNLISQFGDGYEQRLPNGINNDRKIFNLTYKDRTKGDTEDIIDFFELKNGVTAFDFKYDKGDGAETSIKVICSNWDWAANHDGFHTVIATFKEVFEP